MAVVTVVVSWEAAAKVGVSTVAVARAVAWREVVVWAVAQRARVLRLVVPWARVTWEHLGLGMGTVLVWRRCLGGGAAQLVMGPWWGAWWGRGR